MLALVCPGVSSVAVERTSCMPAPDHSRAAIELDYLLSEKINGHCSYRIHSTNDGRVSRRHLEELGKIQC